MAVTVLIPTPLRQFAGGKSEAEVEATTAGEALDALTTEFPELRKHLFTEQDALRNFINVYVGDEDIRYLDGAGTEVPAGETVTIVPSIAGGNTAAEAKSADLPELTTEEYQRYSRHLILPEVGLEGQRKLKNARVLTIGTGVNMKSSAVRLFSARLVRVSVLPLPKLKTVSLPHKRLA